MEFTIRVFQPHDYSQVRELWRSSGLTLNRSDDLPSLLRTIERDPELFLVAEAGGEIIGAVLARFDGRRAYIYHLAVSAKHRGNSIGTALMDETMSRLKAMGCEKVNLHVTIENAGVTEFYEGLGFTKGELIYMGKWMVD